MAYAADSARPHNPSIAGFKPRPPHNISRGLLMSPRVAETEAGRREYLARLAPGWPDPYEPGGA